MSERYTGYTKESLVSSATPQSVEEEKFIDRYNSVYQNWIYNLVTGNTDQQQVLRDELDSMNEDELSSTIYWREVEERESKRRQEEIARIERLEEEKRKKDEKSKKVGIAVSFIGLILSLVILGVSADSYNEEAGLFLGVPVLIASIVGLIYFIKKGAIKTIAQTIRKHSTSSFSYKEKCYKRIDEIHGYYERGSITQEEFEALKKEILSEIE